MKRNLYFYLYPVRGSVWSWHLEQLRKFRSVFNGRRIVVVACDRRTAALSAVRERLGGLDATVLRVANDPARGETRSFLKGLSLLESRREDEMTFYAHGKGVTHAGIGSLIMQSWSEAMYRMNLSAIRAVESLMRDYSAVGCFRQEMPHGGSWWHYSGTFFWFKHSAVFVRDWRNIQRGRYGVEGYLGKHIPIGDSFSSTPPRHFTDLYRYPVTREECRRWLRALRGRRPGPSGGRILA